MGVDSNLKQPEAAAHEVLESAAGAGTRIDQAVNCLFVRAECAVVLDVQKSSAEGELMLALAPGQIFADFDEVLRSAEGKCVSGRGLRVAGEVDVAAIQGHGRTTVDIECGADSLSPQGLCIVVPRSEQLGG